MSFAGIPTNIWICDSCSVTNRQFSNPDYCSVCTHKRCSGCAVGTATLDSIKRPCDAWLMQYPPREELSPDQNADDSENIPVDLASPTGGESAPFDSSVIDNLARDFEYKAHVGDVLIEESPDLPLLGGYDLSLNLVKDPQNIFYLKHKWEDNPEMNNRFWLTNSGERVHFGFKGEELISAKALALDYRPIKPNNLDVPIHPLFQLDHWNNTPDDVYRVLKPALRLATMFLRQERCMRWWSIMLLGEREPEILGAERSWHPAQRIKAPVSITPGNSFQAIEYLHEKGEDVVEGEGHLVSFRFIEKLTDCSGKGSYYGYTKKVGAWEGSLPLEQEWMDHFSKKKMHRTIVKLHGDFYNEACKLRALRFPDENQKLRFYLFFAVTLCHEVAHAIEQADVHHGKDTPYFVPEPFVGDMWERESGNMWEKFTFGGKIWPINCDMSCKYGLSTQAWPCPPGDRDWQNTIYSIPMDWIEKIQQQGFWDDNEDILTGETQQELEQWLFPPRGLGTAKAWGSPVVLTMLESEFLRVLQEDFEEEMGLQEKQVKEATWRQKLREEEQRERKLEQKIQNRQAAALQKETERLAKEAEKTSRRQRHAMLPNRRKDAETEAYERIADLQPPLRLVGGSGGRDRSRSPRRTPRTEAEDRMESRKAGTRKPREEP